MPTQGEVVRALDESSVKLLAVKGSTNGNSAYSQMKKYYDAAVIQAREKGINYEPPPGLEIDLRNKNPNALDEVRKIDRENPVVDRRRSEPSRPTATITVAPIDPNNPDSNQINAGTSVFMKVGGYYITTPKYEFNFLLGHQVFIKAMPGAAKMNMRLGRSQYNDGPGVSNVRISMKIEREQLAADPGLIGQYGHLYWMNFGASRYTYAVGDWEYKSSEDRSRAASWYIIPFRNRSAGVNSPTPGVEYLLYNHASGQYLTRTDEGELTLVQSPTIDSIVTFEVPEDQRDNNGTLEVDDIEKIRRDVKVPLDKYFEGTLSLLDTVGELARILFATILPFLLRLLIDILLKVLKLILDILLEVAKQFPLLILGLAVVGYMVLKK